MEVENVEKLRRKIDGVDDQIVRILIKRMLLASDVIGAKKDLHWPVRNLSREREIIGRARAMVFKHAPDSLKLKAKPEETCGNLVKHIAGIFERIISASREFGDWDTRSGS